MAVGSFSRVPPVPGLEAIKMIPLAELKEIRRYSASEAQTKFGLNNMGGAIQVVTVRQ